MHPPLLNIDVVCCPLDFALCLLFLELGFCFNPFVYKATEFQCIDRYFVGSPFRREVVHDKCFLRANIPAAIVAGTFNMFLLFGENLVDLFKND